GREATGTKEIHPPAVSRVSGISENQNDQPERVPDLPDRSVIRCNPALSHRITHSFEFRQPLQRSKEGVLCMQLPLINNFAVIRDCKHTA
ncbi:MAG TPA: hypothetical protein VIH22_06450, partial [Cyclobacteriaceae bacterium]